MTGTAVSYWARNRLPDPTGRWTCLDVFHAALSERVAMIKAGVPARWVQATLGDFMRGCGAGVPLPKLSTRTLNRKAAADVRLSLAQSERVVDLAAMIGQVEAMARDSGVIEGFNAATWLADWATSPLPALGGERPIAYLDTWEGRCVVSRLLAQMQSVVCA